MTPPINGSINSSLTIIVGTGTPAGTYTVQAIGTGGGLSRSYNIQLTIPRPNDAVFVSQSVPAAMAAGNRYNVSVTMRNTGGNTWTSSAGYRLGSQSPQDNQTWGFGRVNLTSTVPFGSNAIFNFVVTAPSTPGAYNFQWRMLQQTIEWFGEQTPLLSVNVYAPLANDAAFVSQTVPTSMTAGSSYSVRVRMRNTGTNTWTSTDYRLGSQNPQDNRTWGLQRITVPTTVAPNGEVDINFTVTAPSTPGVYNFQWRMLQIAVEWFGQYSKNIAVTVPSP